MKTFFCNVAIRFLLSDKRFHLVDQFGASSKQKISCVIPVYNQEKIIKRHLIALLDNVKFPIELIVINDSSTDNTQKELIDFIFECRNSSVFQHSIRLFNTQIPMYESRCEDFGFRISQGEFLMSVQADMMILHKHFDVVLLNTLVIHPDLGLISCRGTHALSDLAAEQILRGRELSDGINSAYLLRPLIRFKQKIMLICRNFLSKNKPQISNKNLLPNQVNSAKVMDLSDVFPNERNASAGWLGERIEALPYSYEQSFMDFISEQSSRVWTNETVMRGPLFMRKSTYVDVGGYDIRAFYQGLDDHDLSIRINDSGLKVGFSPIYFSAPLRLGVARQTKSFRQRIISEIHVRVRKRFFTKSFLILRLFA